LLDGISVLVVGGEPEGSPREGLTVAVREACVLLGARVSSAPAPVPATTAVEPDAASPLARALVAGLRPDLLVFDAAGLFAAARARSSDGYTALGACMAAAWEATHLVVNRAFLAGADAARPGGRIVYLAPAPRAGEHADAVRAGLENLARTLSVEWARHAITPVAIALGDTTAPGEAAALTAYLASPAGAYFSGCLLDLRGA
jgi:NAD(P)-dependent dehydrogenase (short-subunit alcohol dehydrogenase family)